MNHRTIIDLFIKVIIIIYYAYLKSGHGQKSRRFARPPFSFARPLNESCSRLCPQLIPTPMRKTFANYIILRPSLTHTSTSERQHNYAGCSPQDISHYPASVKMVGVLTYVTIKRCVMITCHVVNGASQ